MDTPLILALLENYQTLVKRVNEHTDRVEKTYQDRISCKKGCDACCRFLSLFPVEALALAQAFSSLPPGLKTQVEQNLKNDPTACPLLIDRACVLYPARPIICRTHGYPILVEKDGERLVDFCPENFDGITSFPKDALLDIEHLNVTLYAINQHFMASIDLDAALPDRIPVSEALFLFM